MNTETRHIIVSGLTIEVVRKDIKNLHLGVYPPNGRVRVATPWLVSDEAVRLAVIEKLGWINRQKAKLKEQSRQSQREMVNGESHYFMGRRYRLQVHEQPGPSKVTVRGHTTLHFHVDPGASTEKRGQLLQGWYRKRLKEMIPSLIEKWQERLGVQVAAWGIRKMKTKWGSCNVEKRSILINLELAKKPPQCLEYIVVHELVHLLERKHSDRFQSLMDYHLPVWRLTKDELNRFPLDHEE